MLFTQPVSNPEEALKALERKVIKLVEESALYVEANDLPKVSAVHGVYIIYLRTRLWPRRRRPE